MQRLPNGKALFHLVTKEKFNQKPSYKNFRETLKNLKQYLISNNIDNISIPKIGCGKDKLSWEKVKTILHEIFSDSNIKITVYLLSQNSPQKLENFAIDTENESNIVNTSENLTHKTHAIQIMKTLFLELDS